MSNNTKLEYTSENVAIQDHVDLKNSFLEGVLQSAESRKQQLRQLGFMVQDHAEDLAKAMQDDLGRPALESFSADITPVLNEIHEALTHLDSWMKPQRVRTDWRFMLTGPKTIAHPLGIVLIIGTWNYPLSLLLTPLVGALAGGNTAVIKPSEVTPAVANLVTKLIPQYLDRRVVRVVNGNHELNNNLLKLHWNYIFVTGSSTIGKVVAKSAAEHLTPITLELGGKSPAIVFDDADVTLTARRLLWGKSFNLGQTCIAPDYVICSKAMEPKLVQALRVASREFFQSTNNLASWASDGKDVGKTSTTHIINQKNYDRLTKLLQDSKGELVELRKGDKDKLLVPVTVVRHIKPSDSVMSEEIFGPILPILTFETKEETTQFINSRDEPLAAYVFTRSKKNVKYIFENTRSGSFLHNGVILQFVIPGLPFGGVGPSGVGNYHGRRNFDTFSHERSYATIPGIFELALQFSYPPYTSFRFGVLKRALGPARITRYTGSTTKTRIFNIIKFLIVILLIRRFLF